jgi:hypothetical protein
MATDGRRVYAIFATGNIVIFFTRLVVPFCFLKGNLCFCCLYHNAKILVKQYLSIAQTEVKITAQKETE